MSPPSSGWKTSERPAKCSSEISVDFQLTTRRYIPVEVFITTAVRTSNHTYVATFGFIGLETGTSDWLMWILYWSSGLNKINSVHEYLIPYQLMKVGAAPSSSILSGPNSVWHTALLGNHADTLAVPLPTDLTTRVYPSTARHIALVAQSTQLANRWARGSVKSRSKYSLVLHSECLPTSRQRRILNWQQRLWYSPE
jgi:hypothetical protein